MTNDISKSINSIYNIVIETKYTMMITNINQILNNYLKIYDFLKYNITNIYVQIYNQNIDLVSWVNIQIIPFKYINIDSKWYKFITGIYFNSDKIIYSQLNTQQQNDLRYSIISTDLYFIDDLNFIYNDLNTFGIILKPKYNNNDYSYVTTLYWN